MLPPSGDFAHAELLGSVLEAGDARIAAILIDHDPELVSAMDLLNHVFLATQAGHADLAALLSSIIEARALTAALPRDGCLDAPDPSVPASRRL